MASMLTKEQSNAQSNAEKQKTLRLQTFDSGELSSENFVGFEQAADAEATGVKRSPLASFLTGGLGSLSKPGGMNVMAFSPVDGVSTPEGVAFLSN